MDSIPLSPTPVAPTPSEQPRHRSWIRYLIVALLFAAMAFTLQRGWSEIQPYSWQIDHVAVAVALGFWVLTTLGSGFCWLVVCRAIGIPLPVAPALRVFCTSNLGKYLPGKVMHVLARVYLVQQQGVPLALGTASTVLDVLLYIGAGMLLSLFAIPTALAHFPLLSHLEQLQPLVVGLTGLAVVCGIGLLHPVALNFIIATAGRFVPRLREVRVELRYGTILAVFMLYLAVWLLITAAVFTGVRAVVGDIAPSTAPILGAIFALSYITGLVVPTPAGLGGREAVMTVLFAVFMPPPAAIVAAVLNRLLQVVAEAICSLLLSVLVRR